jgi:hypothetical protein
MELSITGDMRQALLRAGHVPDDLRRRFDAMRSDGEGWTLVLSEDEAMELSELLQWHVRTDPATGRPTAETAPYAAVIQAISERQF